MIFEEWKAARTQAKQSDNMGDDKKEIWFRWQYPNNVWIELRLGNYPNVTGTAIAAGYTDRSDPVNAEHEELFIDDSFDTIEQYAWVEFVPYGAKS